MNEKCRECGYYGKGFIDTDLDTECCYDDDQCWHSVEICPNCYRFIDAVDRCETPYGFGNDP